MCAKRSTKPEVTIPHVLREAIKEGAAVAVLGAGASLESKACDGRRPPTANQLRDHIAKKFLGTENEERDLATVSEMAIIAGAGVPQVFDEVARLFKGMLPSTAHERLADFRWRGLATTNYDRLIEDGYGANSSALQACVPFVKNKEPYEDRLRAEKNPVPLLKLHGCLQHRLDSEVPLILSNEHYAQHFANRDLLFNRLKDWASSSVLVFVGYRLADAHIRQLIYQINPNHRPRWYLVSPGADEHEVSFWAGKGVDVIPTTFAVFMDALEDAVPSLFRSLSPPSGADNRPYTRHFRHGNPSDDLVASLEADFEYVHATIPFEDVTPEKFYSGHARGWCGTVRKFDFERRVGQDLLFEAASVELNDTTARLYTLIGPAGSGKTIALRRAAFDAATALGQLVLWLRPDGVLRSDMIEELYGLTGLRTFVFVDHVALHADELARALHRLKAKGVPITVVASERGAEWTTYCESLEDFSPQQMILRRLSEREAESLMELLERHSCLGRLLSLNKSDRIAAFMDKERADRQLLVALHELTQGKPFEEIIQEEFQRIHLETARTLYLDIATMHQFGVTARAGAISRISGISFSDFEEEFFTPLQDIVHLTVDRPTGDRGYETRHAHVADILFRVICQTDEERSHQLARIIEGLDPGYTSDQRILTNVCKGRQMATTFSSVESAREIFLAAMTALPGHAFLHQQAAILEMTHRQGSLELAEERAREARALDDRNHIYVHTMAEVARRRANETNSAVKAEQFRASSRRLLNEIKSGDPRKSLTFCNLLIDEALALLRSLPDDPKEYHIRDFDRKVDEAKQRLDRAQRDFPGSSEFPAAEGRLWQQLGEDERAKHVLTKASSLKNAKAGVFLRLAQVKSGAGDLDGAIKSLSEAISRNSNEKACHFELAMLLLQRDRAPSSEIEGHLRASYAVGDHAMDARFFHACYLFLIGKIEDCQSLFQEVDDKAPSAYRTRPDPDETVIDQLIGQQSGSVASIKQDFFFIQSGCYPTQIFAHSSSLAKADIDELSNGQAVKFRVRFNRKGPVAVTVT